MSAHRSACSPGLICRPGSVRGVDEKISKPGGADPCDRVFREWFENVEGLPPFIFEAAGKSGCEALYGDRVRRSLLQFPEGTKMAETKRANPLHLKYFFWCLGRESNPHAHKEQGILSPLCLPVPPPRHSKQSLSSRSWPKLLS